jgi:AcrR family transcriptional regulator
MATKHSQSPARKPRTDAQRNRQRIVEIAKQAFTRFGANASLDDIASQAGVGPGTLYRHFPTRDALIEGVYRAEVEKLAAAARDFAAALPPLEALRAWMLLFVDHIAAKQIIAPALHTLMGGPSKLYEGGRGQIQGAIDALVKRAIPSGDIRSDLDPFDPDRRLTPGEIGPRSQSRITRHLEILPKSARSKFAMETLSCSSCVGQFCSAG